MSGLFSKEIAPSCAYCEHGTAMSDGKVICLKKGISDASSSCRAFRYDPFKRTPPVPAEVNLSGLRREDFTL